MKRIFIMALLPLLISCGKAAWPGDRYIHMLTGECLNSTELRYYLPDGVDQQTYGNCFVFGFTLDINCQQEKDRYWNDYIHRFKPSDEIYDNFGTNKETVRNEYNAICETLENEDHGDGVITLLYNGGISLTADKEFAGYSAGEDLGHLIHGPFRFGNYCGEQAEAMFGVDPVIATTKNIKSRLDPIFQIPLDYISMPEGDGVSFHISMGDYKLTDEKVTFELKIPVRVVMYLNWLNDKISNPDAPVPYEDKVLHCTFTTRYGLR